MERCVQWCFNVGDAIASQIVASSWFVCTNSLHWIFQHHSIGCFLLLLMSLALAYSWSFEFYIFIQSFYSWFSLNSFLLTLLARTDFVRFSFRFCLSEETICVAFFAIFFLHTLFTLGLCVYAILSFAIFAIPWAIVRLHSHWKREINASCYSFRSRLNFPLSLNLLFAFFRHRVAISLWVQGCCLFSRCTRNSL